ncbi:LysE family translocator [Rhodovulum sp. DZ06]|uniref:LysE family translocator n=1 Tax=Rhodovulum sp. DZ06 TaxID=3425126 RepID=UPI003D329199
MTGAELGLVAGLYGAAVLQPTPATLGLLAESLRNGRGPGLAFAAGLWTGSVAWSLAAAFGLGAFLLAHPGAAQAARVLGGAYLLFLAARAARNAVRGRKPPGEGAPRGREPMRRVFARGLALQLSNAQSALFWAALFSVVVSPELPPSELAQPLLLCALLGVIRFGGLALMFSTARALAVWARAARPLEGLVALLFAAAGAALIAGR